MRLLPSIRPTKREIREAFRRLGRIYGVPAWRRYAPAIDVLVETVLSQNTNDRNSGEGFRRLKAAFPDWAAVASAPWRQVAQPIRVSGLSNIKSRRIQQILHRIHSDCGDYSLAFLRRKPAQEAMEYLRSIPGVGPKTASCVLMFGFGRPVFPVDTHIHRVATRLGWLPDRASLEDAHERLQSAVPAEIVYPLHVIIIRHGRETCTARDPACERCVLLNMCDFGGKRISAGKGRGMRQG